MSTLTREAGERLAEAINEKFRGPGKAFGWAMLHDGDGILDFEYPETPGGCSNESFTDLVSHIDGMLREPSYRPLAGRNPLPSEV